MSKNMVFDIDSIQLKRVFEPIRCKADVISLWMYSLKIILAPVPVPQELVRGKILLSISKMSRIFFESPEKLVSLYFPFSCIVNSDSFYFTRNGHKIDLKAVSDITSLLCTDGVLAKASFFDFADLLMDMCDVTPNIWLLFRELILSEDGYVRFDHDPINQKKDIHPLNHFDIFYSNGSTFKLGCKGRVSLDRFTDILDITTTCHYVESAIGSYFLV